MTWINSEKQWRKFLLVLMLITAPFLASCRSSKNATTEQTTQTEENNDYQQKLDSMVRVEIGKRLTTLHEQNSQSETEVVIFDTSLPADSTTGLPPVKAKVKHRKNVQSKDSTAQTSSEQRTTQVEKQTQDKGKKRTNTHNKTKEQKKPAYTVFYPWFCGLLFVLLVIAVGIIKYKRKNKK